MIMILVVHIVDDSKRFDSYWGRLHSFDVYWDDSNNLLRIRDDAISREMCHR